MKKDKGIIDFGWLAEGKEGGHPISCFHCDKETFVKVRYDPENLIIMDYKPEVTCNQCGQSSYAMTPRGEIYQGQ